MAREIRTRTVDRNDYGNFLKKADEHRMAMHMDLDEGLWNACVVNAIHCAINATDALCVHMLGLRHAGKDHDDAVVLLRRCGISTQESASKCRQLQGLLSIKSIAEYEDRLMSAEDAKSAVTSAERIIKWVEDRIGRP